jgi:hypothetical protein
LPTEVLPCKPLLSLALLIASAHGQQTVQPLALDVEHPMMLHGGDGSVYFTLTNSTPAAIPLALIPGPVTDLVSNGILSKTHIILEPLGNPPTTTSPTSRAAAPGGTVQSAPTAELPKSIPANETLELQATATGVSTANAVFELFNGTTRLGKLLMVAADAPFNIALDGDNSMEKPLDYSLRKPVTIALKDSDPEPYHLLWDFRIDGISQCVGELDVPASGGTRITFTPGYPCKTGGAQSVSPQVDDPYTTGNSTPLEDVFSLVDYFHPSAKQGVLLLSVVGPQGVSPSLLPARTLLVDLRMRRTDATYSIAWSYTYVAIFLFIGGFLSFLASSVLPAMQKKVDLRGQLQQLRNRTTSVSNRVDSYLRVLLRLERNRIADAIDNAPPWLPATADQVSLAASGIATLTKRLTAAERLDDLRRKHDLASVTAPPSVTDGIDADLQSAADHLHSFALSDADLAAANAFLAKAQVGLDMLSDTDALAKQIAGNVSSLKTRFAKFPPNYYADLKASLPGVWVIADPDRGFDDAKNVTSPMLFAIDHGVAAIQLALDYAMVRASVPGRVSPNKTSSGVDVPSASQPTGPVSPTPPADLRGFAAAESSGSTILKDNSGQASLNQIAAPADLHGQPAPTAAKDAAPLVPAFTAEDSKYLGQAAGERLLKRQCQLIELLGTLSWRALRDASLLVQEMREDIYEEDILGEIKKPGQAEITFDTQKTRPFAPVFFNITFRNARLNNAAAVQRLLCNWSFPDQLDERSWKVCHYFTGNEKTEGSPPIPLPPARPPEARTSTPPLQSQVAAPDQEREPHHHALNRHSPNRRWYWPFYRKSPNPVERDFTVYATIRGQLIQESEELPVPPLSRVIHLEPVASENRARYAAESLRFAIAFGVALASLLSGALDQLNKLDFLPATIAIIGLGFTANSIKNLLTQSAAPAQAPTKNPP